MCTVTFLPLSNNDFILTSNRDEQKERETFHPKIYEEDGVKMLFPKDKLAGGTWIGISSKKKLVCVLNGAFKKHKRKDSYTKSRGVIAKELLKEGDNNKFIENMDLKGVEPFTMVIIDWSKNEINLFEWVWDEKQKYLKKLKNEPKIWASSTLYTDEVKNLRKEWFSNWIGTNEFTLNRILEFHHSEIGDKKQAVLMKRSYVETVSITSVRKDRNTVEMYYEDVVKREISNLVLR